MRMSAHEASILAISSTAMLSISVPVPVPPYSVGKGSPRTSCSASSLRTSQGYSARSSISAERGAIFSRAICAIVAQKSRCSCGIAYTSLTTCTCKIVSDGAWTAPWDGVACKRGPSASSPSRATRAPPARLGVAMSANGEQGELEVDPSEVAAWMDNGREVALVDVREPYEREAGHIDGSSHIELIELSARAAELDRDRPVVF